MENKKAKTVSEYFNNIVNSVLTEKKIINPEVKIDPNTANKSGQAKFDNKEDEKALKTGEIELEDIIDKLNAIRAGRSLKDDKINSELENYFNELTKEERIALYAYLKCLSEIVSGIFPGIKAEEPGDPNPNIVMLRLSDKKKINPKVVVKNNTSNKELEDDEPPKPIDVKVR
jgi:hypothetical protein